MQQVESQVAEKNSNASGADTAAAAVAGRRRFHMMIFQQTFQQTPEQYRCDEDMLVGSHFSWLLGCTALSERSACQKAEPTHTTKQYLSMCAEQPVSCVLVSGGTCAMVYNVL